MKPFFTHLNRYKDHRYETSLFLRYPYQIVLLESEIVVKFDFFAKKSNFKV